MRVGARRRSVRPSTAWWPANSTFEDNDADFVTPLEMLRELMNDNEIYAGRQTQTHDLSKKYKDVATVSLPEVCSFAGNLY